MLGDSRDHAALRKFSPLPAGRAEMPRMVTIPERGPGFHQTQYSRDWRAEAPLLTGQVLLSKLPTVKGLKSETP
jgi:hypothetical protein